MLTMRLRSSEMPGPNHNSVVSCVFGISIYTCCDADSFAWPTIIATATTPTQMTAKAAATCRHGRRREAVMPTSTIRLFTENGSKGIQSDFV